MQSLALVLFIYLSVTGCSHAITPELTIFPSKPVLTLPVGRPHIITCKPEVDNPALVSNLEWRDPNNYTIRHDVQNGPKLPMYTALKPDNMLLSLFIPSITENMAGDYTCSASYANTEILRKSIRLETIVAITWKDAPTEQYPTVGKDFKIKCDVEAIPSPDVEWLRNGQEILTNDRFIVESKGLLIRNVQETDDGVYTCQAFVRFTGELDQRNIKVEVQVPPKLVEPEKTSYEIVDGEPAMLSCKAIGKPKPTYTWIKSSTKENLSRADRFMVDQLTGVLRITRAEQSDHSEYQCVARNQAGFVEQTVKVNVLIKPRIYEYYNISVAEASKAKIICKATGRPAPVIKFRKHGHKDYFENGEYIRDGRILVDQTLSDEKGETVAILTIEPLQRSDDGLYECVATNKGGVAYKNGHITVEFRPVILNSKNPPKVWSWGNRPANLSCIAESIPNATIEWRLDEKKIENSPNLKIIGNGPISNLIVTPVDNRYYTLFKCLATNKYGFADKYIELKQAYPPGEVETSRVEVLTATTVRFGIDLPAIYGNLPITAFTVQYKPEQELNWQLSSNKTWSVDSPYIVENLLPQRTYNFRFAAHNIVGRGNFGAEITQTMPSRSYPEEPHILRTNIKDGIATTPYPDHYELRWTIPADNGERIDFYQIKACAVQKVNDEWKQKQTLCTTEEFSAFETTAYELNHLVPDTYYKIELRAHNAIGYSTPSEIFIKTARGMDVPIYKDDSEKTSSIQLIALVIIVVFIVMIIVDLSCFCVNRAGILMFFFEKCRGKPVEDEEEAKLGSYKEAASPVVPPSTLPLPLKLTATMDEKEPLQSNGDHHITIDSGMKRNISVEYNGQQVFTKTGEIIGKNSAV